MNTRMLRHIIREAVTQSSAQTRKENELKKLLDQRDKRSKKWSVDQSEMWMVRYKAVYEDLMFDFEMSARKIKALDRRATPPTH